MSASGSGHLVHSRPGRRGSSLLPDQQGSVMLEAIVAFVLLAIALGPLVGTLLSLADRSTRVQSRLSSTSLGDEAGSPVPAVDRWTWGPRPGEVSWGDGPSLLVTLAGPGTEKVARVGVWVDGWPAAEVDVAGQTSLEVGSAAQWLGRPGAELIIRARTADGPWGPPFRTVVPGSSLTAAVPLEEVSDVPSSATVHFPIAGRLLLLLSGQPVLDPAGPSAEPGLLPPLSPGAADVESTWPSQSWIVSPERRIDLYL